MARPTPAGTGLKRYQEEVVEVEEIAGGAVIESSDLNLQSIAG